MPRRIRLVDTLTSNRNSSNPPIISVIAQINCAAIASDKFMRASSATNRVTITMQTSSAAQTNRRSDQFTRRIRFHKPVVSSCSVLMWPDWGSDISRASTIRARSTIRPRRMDRTLSMPAIPASRNTGATDSWMTTAIFSTAFGYIPVCLRRRSRHQDLSSVDDCCPVCG